MAEDNQNGEGAREGKSLLSSLMTKEVVIPAAATAAAALAYGARQGASNAKDAIEHEDGKVSWDEKIWFSKRHWEGEVTDRRKNRRVAWKTTSGMSHTGVVTFHKLDESLTRVMVTMDFVPQGMVEKMASGLRFVKRAVQADLARFKAYVELGEAKGLEYHSKPAEREGEENKDDEPRGESDEGGDESGAESDDRRERE